MRNTRRVVTMVLSVWMLGTACTGGEAKSTTEKKSQPKPADVAMHKLKYQTTSTRIPLDGSEQLKQQQAEVVVKYDVVAIQGPASPHLQPQLYRVNGRSLRAVSTFDMIEGQPYDAFSITRYHYSDGTRDFIHEGATVPTQWQNEDGSPASDQPPPGSPVRFVRLYRLYENGSLRIAALDGSRQTSNRFQEEGLEFLSSYDPLAKLEHMQNVSRKLGNKALYKEETDQATGEVSAASVSVRDGDLTAEYRAGAFQKVGSTWVPAQVEVEEHLRGELRFKTLYTRIE